MTTNTSQPDLPLFMQSPAARRRDPETSQLSEGWLRRSGILAAQERQVLEALRAHPGTTSQELAKHLPFADRYVTSRRLAGLADKGMVHRGPKRFCNVSRMACITWHPVKAGKAIGTPAAGRQTSRPAAQAREPGPVLSPEQKRQLRERLAASADPSTRKFLASLDQRR